MSQLGFSFVQAGAAIGAAYNEAEAAKAQADHIERIANFNARLADFKARDAIDRGKREAALHLLRTSQEAADVVTSFATQNVVVRKGSAGLIEDAVARAGVLDAVSIQNNAFRQAFGAELEGINATAQGRFAQLGAKNQAFSSLLSGGLTAAGAVTRGVIAEQRSRQLDTSGLYAEES